MTLLELVAQPRFLLFVLALVAFLMYGGFVGFAWRGRQWPTRLLLLGTWIVLLYALAGQAKAYMLNIPFDGFSVVGVVGLSVFNVGLLAVRHKERNRLGEA